MMMEVCAPRSAGHAGRMRATDGRSVTVLMAGPLVLPAAASIVAVSLCQISSGDAHASLPAPVHGIGRYAAHTVRAFPPPCEKNHGCVRFGKGAAANMDVHKGICLARCLTTRFPHGNGRAL